MILNSSPVSLDLFLAAAILVKSVATGRTAPAPAAHARTARTKSHQDASKSSIILQRTIASQSLIILYDLVAASLVRNAVTVRTVLVPTAHARTVRTRPRPVASKRHLISGPKSILDDVLIHRTLSSCGESCTKCGDGNCSCSNCTCKNCPNKSKSSCE